MDQWHSGEHCGDTYQAVYDIIRHERMANFVFCVHLLLIKMQSSVKPCQGLGTWVFTAHS